MNKSLVGISAFLLAGYSQDLYKATSGDISFFSETPMENIDAINKNLKALINSKNGEFAFIATNVGFKFEKPLMEEHFNEKYVESDKYPKSSFVGKILNWNMNFLNGENNQVNVIGKITIHGIEKEIEVSGFIEKEIDGIFLFADFDLKIADFDIEIPNLVKDKISKEVSVEVRMKLKKNI